MSENVSPGRRGVTPKTSSGWVATALGFGVLGVIAVLFAFSDNVTNGGSTMLPAWMRLVVVGMILILAVPAVVLGVKARRTDPSVLGTVALVIATVLGVWMTFTGVAGLFIE